MKILILIVSLVSLSVSPVYSSETGKNDFLKMFEKFKTDFNSKTISSLNDYIDPQYGLFVLDNPGAFINGYYFNSFDSIINSSKETDLYRMKNIVINCEPAEGPLPYYNCDGGKEGWDKEGCYYNNSPEINIKSRVYGFVDENGNSGFDGDGNTNETYKIIQDRLNKSAEQFDHAFYATGSYIGLYFGERDGKFYLLMIDLVTPCDA